MPRRYSRCSRTPEERHKKGLVRERDRQRSAQAAGEHPGRLHHRHPAARGARHRHRRRLHHADPGPPGPRLRNAGGGDRRTGRRGAQGARPDPGVLAVLRQHAAAVRRHRSRQGAEARRADRRYHRHDPDLFRLVLCQRLQPVRPHLPRHGAGRPAVPERDRRSGAAAHPQRRRRHGDARQRREFPRRLRPRPRRALQSLSGVRVAGRHAAGHQFGDRDQHHEEAGRGDAAERLLLRMDRSVLSAGHRRQYRPLRVPDLRAVRVSWCWRRNMAAGACRSRSS